MCVCLLNVGVFTREDRHTDDMKNKQAGIAHEELKTDRKAWIFGGGVPYIYIYIYIYPIIKGQGRHMSPEPETVNPNSIALKQRP